MAGFNTRLLEQTVLANMAKSKVVLDRMELAAKKQFQEKKDILLTEFDEHPVTLELNAASSNPLARSTFISKGNLFSLLGFDEGSKPAEDLRHYLDKAITINSDAKRTRISGNKLIIEIPIQTPTLSEIDNVMDKTSPLVWSPGRSWVTLIQKGITGFGQFVATLLKSPTPSRSGGGLQHPGASPHLSGSVGPIKYVNELLQDFKASITNRK